MASRENCFEALQLPADLPLDDSFRSVVEELSRYRPRVVETGEDACIVSISNDMLQKLSQVAFTLNRIFLPREQFVGWSTILSSIHPGDPEYPKISTLIRNACTSKRNGYPTCQDTGTDVVQLNRGNGIVFEDAFEQSLQNGAHVARKTRPYRSSILLPLLEENCEGKCTGCYSEEIAPGNGPTEIHHLSVSDAALLGRDELSLTFSNKGGGSASKFASFPVAPGLLNDEDQLDEFLKRKIIELGHSACPPYGLEIVLGGTSEQVTASIKANISRGDGGLYLNDDRLEIKRDHALEQSIQFAFANPIEGSLGMGAQGPGRNFLMPNGVKVFRLPRHGATAYIGIGVNCSATRNYQFKITPEGIFHLPLEYHPETFMVGGNSDDLPQQSGQTEPEVDLASESALAELRAVKFGTRVKVTGDVLVARDKAHERWKRHFEEHGEYPAYLSEYVAVMYAGPADAKPGDVIGSIGPTTAPRMDKYARLLFENSVLPLSIAKGSRSTAFRDECKQFKGMYAVLQGGVANELRRFITAIRPIDYEDLGMEAVQVLSVENMPIEMIIDSRGDDAYDELKKSVPNFRTSSFRESLSS